MRRMISLGSLVSAAPFAQPSAELADNHASTPPHTHTHTHTQPLNGCWSGTTRRNTHPLTPILIIRHPLSASSIYNDQWHPLCSFYVHKSPLVQNVTIILSPGPLWSWTLNFILHTFLHTITIFFSLKPIDCLSEDLPVFCQKFRRLPCISH